MNTNPWLNARTKWDSLQEYMRSNVLFWRTAALGSLVLLGGSIATSVVLAHKAPRFTTWVVVADRNGQIVSSGVADHPPAIDDSLKRSALAQWVSQMRGVTSDPVQERLWIASVYAMLAAPSRAETELNEYYRSQNPLERARTETVDVEIRSTLPTGPQTYDVQWTETRRAANTGQRIDETQWRGAFSYALSPPANETQARKNPLGLYITQVAWAQVAATRDAR